MSIYTRTGDGGQTDSGGGGRISKDHPQVAALGELDEMNSHLGLCVWSALAAEHSEVVEALRPVQAELMTIAGMLSGTPTRAGLHLGPDAVARTERQIDAVCAKLLPLDRLVIPGGCELACHLHVARAVCRRTERAIVALSQSGQVVDEVALAYVNRLSDLLFALARLANRKAGLNEQTWTGR